MNYDLIIVGGGCAGLSCAYYSSLHKERILVIERKKEIGKEVKCAEGLGIRALKELELSIEGNYIANEIKKVKIFTPKGKILRFEIPSEEYSLFILNKDLFEKKLEERAKKNNVEFLLNTTVLGLIKENGKILGVKTDKGEIKGKIIVGADGVESRIGRFAGINTKLKLRDIAGAVQHTYEGIDCDKETIEIYSGKKFAPQGYAWVFPKSSYKANVGLGFPANQGILAKDKMEEFANFRVKKGKSIKFIAKCIPISLPLKELVKENILLIGDAARLTNPLSAGGIANALISGKIAGEIISNVIAKNKGLKELKNYEVQWKRKFEKMLIKKYNQRKLIETDEKIERLYYFYFIIKYLPKSILKMVFKKVGALY